MLIADEKPSSARSLAESLTLEGCVCNQVESLDAALSAVRDQACDVVICGVRLGDSNDFELVASIKSLHPKLPVIVGASEATVPEAVEAIKRGAFQYVEKPYRVEVMLALIGEAAALSSPPSQLPPRVLSVLTGELTQESAVMRELVESIALVARSNATVLILGESGTGKERVARAIHAGGPRATKGFVAVNSSAIPESLLESEVFGHARGAFTGATQARRGLMVEADQGTLFLDEIGDMPVTLQPKLLRVLQFGETRPVGSDRIRHVDVRVIAATHRDLSTLVQEGRFREDLRYRLTVIPLLVPPLRDRTEDIAPLVAQFLGEARERTVESPVTALTDEAMSILIQAPWPGNVRELENVIERLVVLGHADVVTARDLAFLTKPGTSREPLEVEREPLSLKEMSQRYVEAILSRTSGDKPRAAQILNVDLSTLYRWERARR